MKPLIVSNELLKLRIEWCSHEIGLGYICYKPLFRPLPRKNYRMGFTIRLLWLLITIQLFERRLPDADPWIINRSELSKEMSGFHCIGLTGSRDHGVVDLIWEWNRFGTMLFYNYPDEFNRDQSMTLNVAWASVSSWSSGKR